MLYGPEWGWNCSRKRGSIILKSTWWVLNLIRNKSTFNVMIINAMMLGETLKWNRKRATRNPVTPGFLSPGFLCQRSDVFPGHIPGVGLVI